jgi:alpha-tubulin suppressor-like RCC1 family protein
LYTVVRKNDGTIWAWGNGGNGQLGDGNYAAVVVPVQLPMTGIAQLAAGFLHSLALASDGGLWAWGSNGSGQLGDGTTDSRPIPSRVAGVTNLSAVAVGAAHSVALRRDGTVITWGENAWGQLGNAALTFRSVPSVIPGLAGVTAVAGGGTVSLALTAQGTVYEWGNLIGYGVGLSSPRLVEGLSGVTAISAGGYHVVAILADRTLRAWGSSYRGRLGNGTDEGTLVPVAVSNLGNVTRVSAGLSHTLAVRADGTVWGWGENDFGQLGDGTTTDRSVPVQVAGVLNAVAVAAGPQHSLALLTDGTVMAWGRNYEGQLGDGNEPMRLNPTRVNGLPPATTIVAGRDFSVALSAGSVWAWGVNYNGGIGCRSCDGRSGPVRIAGIERVTSISTFAFHVLAMRDDGAVYSWGGGTLGELGNGTLVDREYPVVVLHEGGTGSVAGNDWFLDLLPAIPSQIPADDIPSFLVVASTVASKVVADIRYRAQDVGTSASTFVFALAPATIVRGAVLKDADPRFALKARDAQGKAGEVQCALAQLNAQGQLVAVSAASLQAYVSGVLSAQTQSVNVLNSITPDVKGATFFVGYGPNGNAMLTNGTTRGVVTSCRGRELQAAGAADRLVVQPCRGWARLLHRGARQSHLLRRVPLRGRWARNVELRRRHHVARRLALLLRLPRRFGRAVADRRLPVAGAGQRRHDDLRVLRCHARHDDLAGRDGGDRTPAVRAQRSHHAATVGIARGRLVVESRRERPRLLHRMAGRLRRHRGLHVRRAGQAHVVHQRPAHARSDAHHRQLVDVRQRAGDGPALSRRPRAPATTPARSTSASPAPRPRP